MTCVVCPDCAFTFDADHTDEPNGGYSCPLCATEKAAATAGAAGQGWRAAQEELESANRAIQLLNEGTAKLNAQLRDADVKRERLRAERGRLRYALLAIARNEQCTNSTGTTAGSWCRSPHSGRSRDATAGAERWCDTCIARDALDGGEVAR